MKKLYLISLLLMYSITSYTQIYNLDWISNTGGGSLEEITASSIDGFGNIISVGIFIDSIDIDPGPSQLWLNPVGSSDFFIQKLDPNGNLKWAKSIGGIRDDRANLIDIDKNGNIYIIGNYRDTVDFDPNSSVFNLNASSSTTSEMFLLKIDSMGNFKYAFAFSSPSGIESEDLLIDGDTSIYLTGIFRDSVDFDVSTSQNFLISKGNRDCFVVKLDSAANLVWAKSIGGFSNESGAGLALDGNNNLYVTGSYVLTVDFDPGAGVDTLTSRRGLDAFLVKFNNNGNYQWSRSYGGEGLDEGTDVSISESGKIILTGTHSDTIFLDYNSNSNFLTSNGFFDIFLLALDTNGVLLHQRSIGGPSIDRSYKLVSSRDSSLFLIGGFQDSVDFGISGTPKSVSRGFEDGFVLELDENLNSQWIGQIGGPNIDQIASLNISSSSSFILSGFYYPMADLDPTSMTQMPTNFGFADLFVLKISEQTTSIKARQQIIKRKLSVYPNPGNGFLNIDFDDPFSGILSVFKIDGQLVYQEQLNVEDIHQVNLELDPGMYMLDLQGEKRRISRTFLIQ